MTITIANNYAKERAYILHVLFQEFLGLHYTLKISETTSNTYTISWENKQLFFTDDFFPKNEEESYLNTKNLPKVQHYQADDLEIAVLYGQAKIEYTDTVIKCHIDIFASAFFMLTRWEEYVKKERDQHGRFPAKTSVAWQYDLLHRPVVNEYVELLWKMLEHLGINQTRKQWKYKIIPTHDVDLPRLWWTAKDKLRSLGSSLLKRRNLKEFSLLSSFALQKKDPYNTFDYLMRLSEMNNIQSHFFFMSGGTSTYDNHYQIEHPFIQKLLKEIDNRGHKIGFHPSYNAYKDAEQFAQELEHLQANSPQKIEAGRQHFLRFEVPTTWQIWEQHNMTWDSTMGYAEHIGFRCGVCYPFTVFDVVERKVLKLKERPLLAMDVSLQQYQKTTAAQASKQLSKLIDRVRQYGGEMVLLWHNSSFNVPAWQEYELVYEQAIKKMLAR